MQCLPCREAPLDSPVGILIHRESPLDGLRMRVVRRDQRTCALTLIVTQQPGEQLMKLHEIGLFAKDPRGSTKFYHDLLGLDLHHEEPGLAVFGSGWPGLEIGACSGYPDRVHISFVVDDVDDLASELRAKAIRFTGPAQIHLDKRAITLVDPDGLRVSIQSPTYASPDWVKNMVE